MGSSIEYSQGSLQLPFLKTQYNLESTKQETEPIYEEEWLYGATADHCTSESFKPTDSMSRLDAQFLSK